MLIVISPAKTLDFETPPISKEHTQPDFLDDSAELISALKKLEPDQIGRLMSISPTLATLNSNRYLAWSRFSTTENAKQALLAFKGDVYVGLDADTLTEPQLAFAQNHLRILSGLYGLLRPLDLIQPYRLEMGTQFKNQRGKNLYEFWGNKITQALNQTIQQQKIATLVNLASNEYFQAIQTDKLNARVITPVFKDQKNGAYKIISFFAKKARGMMSRYIIQNKISKLEEIKSFDSGGYWFSQNDSNAEQWVFKREDSKAS